MCGPMLSASASTCPLVFEDKPAHSCGAQSTAPESAACLLRQAGNLFSINLLEESNLRIFVRENHELKR